MDESQIHLSAVIIYLQYVRTVRRRMDGVRHLPIKANNGGPRNVSLRSIQGIAKQIASIRICG